MAPRSSVEFTSRLTLLAETLRACRPFFGKKEDKKSKSPSPEFRFLAIPSPFC